MSHDFISDGPTVDDVYYQDTPELLKCTINLDCDNSYDWGLLFSGEEVSQYMHPLEYPEELNNTVIPEYNRVHEILYDLFILVLMYIR